MQKENIIAYSNIIKTLKNILKLSKDPNNMFYPIEKKELMPNTIYNSCLKSFC